MMQRLYFKNSTISSTPKYTIYQLKQNLKCMHVLCESVICHPRTHTHTDTHTVTNTHTYIHILHIPYTYIPIYTNKPQ